MAAPLRGLKNISLAMGIILVQAFFAGSAYSDSVFVADSEAFGGGGGVIRVDLQTGIQEAIAHGSDLLDPYGIAIAPNGDIFVTDLAQKAVYRIGHDTRALSLVSKGGVLSTPVALVIDSQGNLLIADQTGIEGSGGIVKVDPETGSQAVIAAWPQEDVYGPCDIALAADGSVYTVQYFPHGSGKIVRVDPTTRQSSIISSYGLFTTPTGLAIAPDGKIYVADSFQVVRIDPDTGAQSLIFSFNLFSDLQSVAVAADGSLVVSDVAIDFISFPRFGHTGRLIRVNVATGEQSVLTSGNYLVMPNDLAGEPAKAASDRDNDGVPDPVDQCPLTGPGQVVNADGCSIHDLCPCSAEGSNHGLYLNCIARTTEDFLKDGLIMSDARGRFISEAAKSSCGKK